MDFSFPILDGGDLNVQGNWLTVNPATPAKTVPMRAQEIDQGSQSAGAKFLNAMGFPSVQGNSAVSDVRLNLDCWEAALAGQRRNSGHNISEQILSNGTAAWNNIRCSDLLALAEAASSEASTSGNQRESNRGMPRHFFPFQLENSQQESNSGFPLLLNQNYYSIQENSNSPNIFLPSQNYSVISNQRSNSNYQPQQIPQGEFPVHQHPQYDLNSPPRTIAADAVSNGSISFQFEPATPDKGRNEQNSRSEILKSFIDERSEQARNMLQDGNNSIGNNMVQLHCQESQLQSTPLPTAPEHPSQPAVEFLAPPSTQLKQANNAEKGMENGFDLNRTPQQKPRRKKIRPRVVREGKPKTTPKSAAKEANKTGDKPAKRKYVRKNGTGAQNTPNTPPGNAAGKKISDQNASTANKSCKRSLNFNLEGQEQRNVSHQTTVSHLEEQPPSHTDGMSSMFAFDTFSKSQAEPPARSKAVSGNKSTFQLAKGLEVVVNNSSAGTAFDLNRSITQMLEYISLPEKQDPSIAPPERDDRLKENVLDGKIDDAGTSGETHNRSDVPETTSQYISPAESVRTNESATSSISKRGRADSYTHEEASHQPLNLIGGNLNMSLPFPEIHKKRRTEKIQKAARANKSSSMAMLGDTSTEPRTSQSYNSSLGLQYSNACGAENVRNSGSSDLHESFSQTKVHYMQSTPPDGFPRKEASNGIARDRQAAASHYRALATYPASLTIPMPYMPNIPVYQHSRKEASSAATQYKMQAAGNYLHGYCSPSQATTSMQHMHSIPVGMPPRKETPNGATYYKVQASDVMPTLSQTERITKKRSKAPTRVCDFASLTSTSACNSLPSTQTKSYLENYKGSDNGTSIRTLLSHSTSTNGVKLQDNQLMVYSYQKSLPKAKGPRGRPRRVDSPIDELTRKLNSLNINSEHNALVPYTGHGQILPYEGLFDPTKKRKPRAKVDLDLESERVWKLLMGLESDSGAEGTDADKEKWWEEERRVFHGRADSFIARMHLIQGDRRFTKWTGSVVDSVVGVFLTQNVSDHLSSSAFMAMAAHFPLKSTNNDSACNGGHMYVEEPEACIVDSDRDKTREPICNTELTTSNTPEYMENGEMCNSNDSFGSNEGAGRSADIRNCVAPFTDESRHDICDESLKNIATGISGTKHASLPEDVDRGSLEPQSSGVSSQNSVDSAIHTTVRTSCIENDRPLESDERGTLEDLVSSQDSVNSFIAHTDEVARSCSDSNSEEDLTTGCKSKSINTSFMELLQRVDTSMMQECNSNGSGCLSSGFHSEIFCEQAEKRSDNGELNMPNIDGQRDSFSIHLSNSELEPSQNPITHSTKHSLHVTSQPGVLEVECSHVIGAENRFDSPSNVQTLKDINNTSGIGTVTETVSETTVQQNMAYSCSNQEGRNKILNPESAPSTSPPIIDDAMTKVNNNEEQQVKSSLSNHPLAEAFNVVESVFQVDQQKLREEKVAESSMKEQVYSSERVSATTTTNSGKGKRKAEREKKQEFDWDSLRKEALHRCGKRERSHETVDTLDWESVRNADVGEIAETIKERGMNNMLAARIKAFLNRLVKDHGSIDLEWLRDVPPDKAKEYLLSIRGLGLKSVECVRLLTLHHLAFPVDTNVGRIAVRLGWVPLQPLPESLQLHLLELYPIQETIQKYLWPRLCKLDQRTLYELHYQLITFGKVFCTKSKPNCNACPMRAECKHFASAFASARLALPGPEEKGMVSSTTPVEANQSQPVHVNQMSLPPPETNTNLNPSPHITPMPHLPSETNMLSESSSKINSDPIIEMPASPERECTEVLESDIEDAFGEDPDEIPMIKLNIKEFTTNLQNYMQENNMDIQEVDVSKALVALTPEAASIPTPKLKNVSRLRTEHQVYELPDSHPLLNEVEKRIDGDSGSYLLAIWTPGETPESTQPPGRCHSFQTSGSLCNEKTCFSCNSVREANSQTVRGTLLIPCKTAMRGSFPLNGTYFQVNEVFADHASSLSPIDVPRKWLWNLERRTVLFGTSIPTIFKGQTTAEIQNCFWRGYVCVRGFDRKTRAPKPLMARLHFPASKLAKTKETKQEMKGKQV